MKPVYRAPSLPPPERGRTHLPRRWTLVRYVLVVAAAVLLALTLAGRFVHPRPSAVVARRPVARGVGVVHVPAVRRDAVATLDGLAIERAPAVPPGPGARGCFRLSASVAIDEVRCSLPGGESHLFEVRAPGASPDRWRIVVPSEGRMVTLVP